MKFCSIVITKRKLSLIALITGAAAVLGGAFIWINSSRTVSVFNEDEQIYEDILKEGLPDAESADKSFSDILKGILGFDIEKPETIIGEYSPIFDTAKNAEQPSEEPQTSPESTPSVPEEKKEEMTAKEENTAGDMPELPSYEQICSSTGIEVNNATNYSVDPDALCAEPLSFTINKEEPQILIVHTHTTECYDGDNMYGESERNTDESKNVIAVGEAMKEVFESYGIKCIHDKTVHDYPTYQGAYTRELSTVEKNLAQYPSIKMVFDVHRDAYIYPDGSKLTVTCEQNGISTAKVMIVCGTDAMGLDNPNWRENFKLAAKIQNAAQIMYPDLMRPINLRQERFNMHKTTGSLLFEIGSNGNTLAQAIEGGKDLAYAVSAVLMAN